MDATGGGWAAGASTRRIPRVRRIMALVLVVAPILIAFAQFFGGEQIRGGCPIGDMPCTQVRTPGPFPLIGTRDGVAAVTTALGIGWITSAAVLAGSFWRRDRQAAVRMALVMVGAAFMAGVMAFGAGYIAGRRLLAGAEAATIATFIVGLLALIVGLGASARPHSRRFDPPDPTRVPWRAAGLIGLVGIGSSTSSALAGAVVAAVPALVVVTGRGHPSSRAARFAPGDR